MNADRAQTEIKDLKKSVRYNQMIALAAVIAVVLMSTTVMGLKDSIRVVQETPGGDKSRWIGDSTMSDAKLVEAGLWVAHLRLDVGATTVHPYNDLLLNLAHPKFHEQLKQEAETALNKLRDSNAATEFTPGDIKTDVKRLKVALIGELRTRVNSELLPSQAKAYVASFQVSHGVIQLIDWQESSTTNPFGDAKADAAKAAH
jgi:type IV conjugative transfer system protein TraE